MSTFIVTYRTAAECAVHDFEAETAAEALAQAQEFWRLNSDQLHFESYDMLAPLEEIAVEGENPKDTVTWLSDAYRLQFAAGTLRDALKLALAALNTVPRFKVPGLELDSYRIAARCKAALKAAEGGAA